MVHGLHDRVGLGLVLGLVLSLHLRDRNLVVNRLHDGVRLGAVLGLVLRLHLGDGDLLADRLDNGPIRGLLLGDVADRRPASGGSGGGGGTAAGNASLGRPGMAASFTARPGRQEKG